MAPAEKALTHLQRLEAESIHIMREVVAECEKPVMLYSIGKDSAVMLHLALQGVLSRAAAVPAAARRHDLEIPGDVRVSRPDGARLRHGADRAHQSEDGRRAASIPSTTVALHTDVMKTAGAEAGAGPVRLRRGLRRRAARRGEESRAKERIFSFRTAAAPLGPEEPAARNSGTSTTPARSRARASASFRSRTGPSSTSGNTSICENIPIVPLYFARRAPGGRARRPADHGRRRAHAAAPGETAETAHGPLPHARLLSADRRDREQRGDLCRDHPGDAADHDFRAAGPGRSTTTRRPRWRRRSRRAISDGRAPDSYADELAVERHRSLSRRAPAQEPAALHHLRHRSTTASRR